MKIAVLGGSPKSNKNSITMHYIRYLQKNFTSHDFLFLQVSRDISPVSKTSSVFSEIISVVSSCDAVLWAFPVYYYLVPSQYKKFIELIFENNAQDAFYSKYTASFSTSIHNCDDIAHDYIAGICDDLGMHFVDFFSSDMYDFLDPKKLEDLILFFKNFLYSIDSKSLTARSSISQKFEHFSFSPGIPAERIDPSGKKFLILADSLDKKTNIRKMCDYFSGSFSSSQETLVLNKLPIRSGCTGCLVCGHDNACPLSDNVVFNSLHSKISEADIIIFAGEIKDRFFSSLWKLFFDRLFSCGHPPNIFINKQIAFLVSGPINYTGTLSRFIQAFAGTEKANLAGIVTDESGDSYIVSKLLSQLAKKILYFSSNNFTKPLTFVGVGGIKINRDDIWGRHSYVFRSDFKGYKKTKVFDLFLKKIGVFLYTRTAQMLLIIPFFRRSFYKNVPGLLSYCFRKFVK